MKYFIIVLSFFYSVNLFSQLEFIEEEIEVNYDPIDRTKIYFGIENKIDSIINFNWEFEFDESIENFIDLDFYDFEIHYNPNVKTNCEFNRPNTLKQFETDSFFLYLYQSEMNDMLLAQKPRFYLNLLNHPECDTIIASIPITIIRNLSSNLNNDIRKIRLFPNPTNANLNLKGVQPGVMDFRIFDTKGNSVKSGSISSQLINVEELQAGVYIVVIYSEGIIFQQKFVKL